jgi:ABC-type nickel/cobalt efflux system permease component RcnA
MTDFATLLQHGNAWLFVPSAIALGALHGLEPGHSKTMMAAFIVAVRGTVGQAVLLGLAATLSHTAVVWLIALGGLYFGRNWSAEASEPYLQIASGVAIVAIALWMMWRTSRREPACFHDHGGASAHAHAAGHDHDHDHGHGHGHDHGDHHDHSHDHGHDHGHGHDQATVLQADALAAVEVAAGGDPHALEHVADIRTRFGGRHVTTSQIVFFGLTGGLIPCPASVTVLLLCLQMKQLTLGATLVLSFSVGLALTMVASGVLAALSIRHVAGRWSGFGQFADKAPLFSGALILLVGLFVGWQGVVALR